MATANEKALRKQYSKLRGIAMKRSARLVEAGFPGAPDFAKLRDISNVKVLKRELAKIERWLNKPTSTVKGARFVAANETEAEKKRRKKAASNKKYYEKKKQEPLTELEQKRLADLRKHGVKGIGAVKIKRYSGLTDKEFNLIKSAATLGVKLSPDDVKQFAEYLAYRHEQVRSTTFYTFDKWLDEFVEMREAAKDKTAADIIADFEQYKVERADFIKQVENDPAKIKAERFDDLFSDVMKRYKKRE